jgi:hypothetical protein
MKGAIMKYIMKIVIPNEYGNTKIKDPQFSSKMKEALTEVKAEAAYFATICGCRGAYIVVNIDDASQLPALAEPFFLWLQADVDFTPVMTPEDLGKAGASIDAAVKKWGK